MTFEEFKETYPYSKKYVGHYTDLQIIYQEGISAVWSSNIKSKKLHFCFNIQINKIYLKYTNLKKKDYLELQKINEHIDKYYTIQIKLDQLNEDFKMINN